MIPLLLIGLFIAATKGIEEAFEWFYWTAVLSLIIIGIAIVVVLLVVLF